MAGGDGIIIVAWLEAALGTIMVALRFYTRGLIIRKIGWDDWTMLLTLLLCYATSAMATLNAHFGIGKHTSELSPPEIVNAVKYIWISSPFSIMSTVFGKISIALLITRMINRNLVYYAFIWGLMFGLFASNLSCVVVNFVQCDPVPWVWDRTNPAAGYVGTCWPEAIQRKYGYFQGAVASFSDLCLALFPILIIKDLKLDLRIKIGLSVALSLGIVACIAAALKTYELRNLATPDFTYDGTNLVYWYLTESWSIVIAACIPTLGPLYFIMTGQRTRESYAAKPRSSSKGMGSLLAGWKLRSPIVRSSGRSSRQEKSIDSSTLTGGDVNWLQLEQGSLSSSHSNKPAHPDPLARRGDSGETYGYGTAY